MSDWQKKRKKTLERDGHKCQDCDDSPEILHVHHITPKHLGGGDELENLVSLCENCHEQRHRDLIISNRNAVLCPERGCRKLFDTFRGMKRHHGHKHDNEFNIGQWQTLKCGECGIVFIPVKKHQSRCFSCNHEDRIRTSCRMLHLLGLGVE
jgi:hypothetical protein